MRAALRKTGPTKHKFVPQSYATDIKEPEDTKMLSSLGWKDVKNVVTSYMPARPTTRMIALGVVAAVAAGIYFSKRRSKLGMVQELAKKALH
ncbi:hypothetical protein [Bdellovibrio sp. HCB337]|uniref:hypothetical protein n=1 Tax=Bdellovibrio sp. HCB337 TaxID=3394358 RepID=UPI0039A52A54